MAHTQFEPRNRAVGMSDLIALIPVVLLIGWVAVRSFV